MAEDEGRPGKRWPRRLRRLAALLVVALVVHVLVVPQLAGARQAVELLGEVQVGWLLAGLGLASAAIAAYAALTRTLLPPEGRPRYRTLLGITLSTLGLSHVVPGGTAVGSSLGYRMLTSEGVRGSDAAFAIATQGLGSAVVLNLLLWVGLVVSIPLRGLNPLYGTAAVLGALLLALVGVTVVALTRGEDRMAGFLGRLAARVPFLDAAVVADGLRRVAARLRALAAQPRVLAQATGWATVNWLLDAAALWVFLAAFGYRLPLDGLIVSYGLANVLAAVPITPGGLGVVEGVLGATLVGFGAPSGVALLAVVAYRLVNFWLPIPLGAVSYLSLRARRGDGGRASDALREAATDADRDAPRPAQWARARGVRVPWRRAG